MDEIKEMVVVDSGVGVFDSTTIMFAAMKAV